MAGAQGPATGGDQDRACPGDRERLIDTLKEAFAQDRLTRSQLDALVAQALTARPAADLAALSAGIPALAGSARPPLPARRRPLARAIAGSGGCVIAGLAALLAGGQLDHPGSAPDPWSQLCLAVAIFAIAVAPLIGTLAAATGYKKAPGHTD